ncbi:hypothetical protein SUGI_1201020 [Cryptomeria japonica]|nr:hypothetical protein SUGI_1201020 [Cryptomeria japonica]
MLFFIRVSLNDLPWVCPEFSLRLWVYPRDASEMNPGHTQKGPDLGTVPGLAIHGRNEHHQCAHIDYGKFGMVFAHINFSITRSSRNAGMLILYKATRASAKSCTVVISKVYCQISDVTCYIDIEINELLLLLKMGFFFQILCFAGPPSLLRLTCYVSESLGWGYTFLAMSIQQSG